MILEEFQLDGQAALLMGAASSEGNAISAALAEAGARVAAVRDSSQNGAELRGAHAEFDADLTSETDVERVVAAATNEVGPIDILVNALQVTYARPLLETTSADWRRLLDLNVVSMALSCQIVGQGMVDRGSGKIVNLASGIGVRGLPSSVPFAASEGAVMALTAALAIEWAANGIKVNAAAPVWLESGAEAENEAGLLKYIPMRRRGTLEELANLVVFLSCDGSHFLTGKTMFLDGAVLSHA